MILHPLLPGADPVPEGLRSLGGMASEEQGDDVFGALLLLLLQTSIGGDGPRASAPAIGPPAPSSGPPRRQPAQGSTAAGAALGLPYLPAAEAPDLGVLPQPLVESHDPAAAAPTAAPTAAVMAEARRAGESLSVPLGPQRASLGPPSSPPELQVRLQPNATRGAVVAVPEPLASDAQTTLLDQPVAPPSVEPAEATRGATPANTDRASPSLMTEGRVGPVPSAPIGARATLAAPDPPSPPSDGALPVLRPAAVAQPAVAEAGQTSAAGRPAEARPDAGPGTGEAPEPADLGVPVGAGPSVVAASASAYLSGPADAPEATSVPPDSRAPLPIERLPRQIVAHARLALEDGTRHVEMQLHPPHLGRVSVTVSVQGHEVSLNLATDNPAAQQLLSMRLPELALALSEAGMSLLQANVSVNDRGRGRQGAPQHSGQSQIERVQAASVEGSTAGWQSSSLHVLDVSA